MVARDVRLMKLRAKALGHAIGSASAGEQHDLDLTMRSRQRAEAMEAAVRADNDWPYFGATGVQVGNNIPHRGNAPRTKSLLNAETVWR